MRKSKEKEPDFRVFIFSGKYRFDQLYHMLSKYLSFAYEANNSGFSWWSEELPNSNKWSICMMGAPIGMKIMEKWISKDFMIESDSILRKEQ